VLGRAALFLYVAHHVIVVTLAQRTLGVSLHSWPYYWLATAALLVVLMALGAAWTAFRSRRRTPVEDVPDLSAAA
jgi:hypothetical protein